MAKFQERSEIGRGGFCVVHNTVLVDDGGKQVGEVMALKKLQDTLFGDQDEIRARFQREARLMDDVLDHPRIVRVVYRNVSGDDPYFVMPKADGSVADELAERSGDEGWVNARFREMLEGMAYAHGKSVIHRDLKPENALLYEGEVRLSDFGLGKALEGGTIGVTKSRVWSGTEPYMAPEQFTDMQNCGPQADVFALGKVLIAMLTGRLPDVGPNPDVSDLPDRYRYFVSRCCETKAENRFEDAKEALDIFDRRVLDTEFAELPEDTLSRLVEEWFAAPAGKEDLAIIRRIDEHLRSVPDEEALYTREVPRLPEDIVNQYMDDLPEAFEGMITIYDRHVSGGLTFEYCDVVADFYAGLFRRSNRLSLRKLILIRLFEMGYAHNRWHVQTIAMELLAEVRDVSTVSMAADVIRATSEAARWTGRVAAGSGLPRPILQAFKDVGGEEA